MTSKSRYLGTTIRPHLGWEPPNIAPWRFSVDVARRLQSMRPLDRAARWRTGLRAESHRKSFVAGSEPNLAPRWLATRRRVHLLQNPLDILLLVVRAWHSKYLRSPGRPLRLQTRLAFTAEQYLHRVPKNTDHQSHIAAAQLFGK